MNDPQICSMFNLYMAAGSFSISAKYIANLRTAGGIQCSVYTLAYYTYVHVLTLLEFVGLQSVIN